MHYAKASLAFCTRISHNYSLISLSFNRLSASGILALLQRYSMSLLHVFLVDRQLHCVKDKPSLTALFFPFKMNKFIILCAFYVFNIYSRKQRLWMLWEYLLDTQLLLRYKLYNECIFSKYQKPSEVLLLEAPYWKWSAASSLFSSTCILIYEF